MTKKKRGLGRGLDKLLSTSTTQQKSAKKSEQLCHLAIESMQSGKYQPRRDMRLDALEDLTNSIRTQGIIQPIVVRSIGPNRYEIIAGERRWRAAQMAGLHDVPVVIKDYSDEDALAVSLIENLQREDLNPIEEAIALQRLIDEFNMTHQQVAEAVGKSRAAVSNALRLIALNLDVKTLLENGDLEMGHARALLALEGVLQTQAARTVVAKGFSVRETERLVKQLQQKPAKLVQTKSIDPDVKQLQQDLSERLGVAVTIQHGANGKGKLTLKYHSIDELEGILEHIN